MRAKWILVMCMLMVFCAAGCDSFWMGLGAGAAGQETVESWKENLDEKKAELAAQYDQKLLEYQTAADPNTKVAAKQELETIADVQLANAGALLAVENILALPDYQGKTPSERSDMIVTALIGAGLLGLREWQKHKLKNKYISMKVGKHDFEAVNPEAGKDLHLLIGKERIIRGL